MSILREIAGHALHVVKSPIKGFRMLTTGDSALGKVQIVTGLREGEKVVVSGGFTLKSMLLKSSLREEE